MIIRRKEIWVSKGIVICISSAMYPGIPVEEPFESRSWYPGELNAIMMVCKVGAFQ